MVRVAIAGTGGLARYIAHFIRDETSHTAVILSRSEQPTLAAAGHQVAVVDYQIPESLQFALLGCDTVLSTVTGPNQIELIKAAVVARVRRFAPAEYEGSPRLRDPSNPLDRQRSVALRLLAHYSQSLETTIFVCGIFYERFQPGGLAGAKTNLIPGLDNEGDYIMNCSAMFASFLTLPGNTGDVTICMTALQDVGRFVTKALDLPQWPQEMRICGQRITVRGLLQTVAQLKKQQFNPLQVHTLATLALQHQVARQAGDASQQNRVAALINTINGYYDFEGPCHNNLFPDWAPMDFRTWFILKWHL